MRTKQITDEVDVTEEHALGMHLVRARVRYHQTDSEQIVKQRAGTALMEAMADWYGNKPATYTWLEDQTYTQGLEPGWGAFVRIWRTHLHSAPTLKEVKTP